MILEKGNMWDAFGKGVFVITTNPITRQDGAVVMGRGIALQAATKFPSLPYHFGNLLKQKGNQYAAEIGLYNNTPVWYCMVKHHWKDQADLSIIATSLYKLRTIFHNTLTRVDLNFPGIGNGRLNRDSVLYLLEDLSDNFHIWEYE